MIGIQLRVRQQEGVIPAYAEAYGKWTVDTPVTREEYERFCEELNKAEDMATQMYLKSNGLKEVE